MAETQNAPEFSAEAVNQAIEAAQRHARAVMPQAVNNEMTIVEGALQISAQCISVNVQNGQVCVNLPLGLGHKCLPVPSWVPNGQAAQACLDLCTKWGIPCGVQVTVSVAGSVVVKQGFGCSC